MTKERFRMILTILGWGSSELARRLNVAPVTVGRWMNDRHVNQAPTVVTDWLELIVAAIEQTPVPLGWCTDIKE